MSMWVQVKMTAGQMELVEHLVRKAAHGDGLKAAERKRCLALWRRLAKARGCIVRKTRNGKFYETPRRARAAK